MRILCDEGVERQIVERFREDGHDVAYVAEDFPGASDNDVLARAAEDRSLLVTTDKDFGELVFRQQLISGGVLLLRLAGLSNEAKARIAAGVLRDHGQELIGAFGVASARQIRIRQPPKSGSG